MPLYSVRQEVLTWPLLMSRTASVFLSKVILKPNRLNKPLRPSKTVE